MDTRLRLRPPCTLLLPRTLITVNSRTLVEVRSLMLAAIMELREMGSKAPNSGSLCVARLQGGTACALIPVGASIVVLLRFGVGGIFSRLQFVVWWRGPRPHQWTAHTHAHTHTHTNLQSHTENTHRPAHAHTYIHTYMLCIFCCHHHENLT